MDKNSFFLFGSRTSPYGQKTLFFSEFLPEFLDFSGGQCAIIAIATKADASTEKIQKPKTMMVSHFSIMVMQHPRRFYGLKWFFKWCLQVNLIANFSVVRSNSDHRRTNPIKLFQMSERWSKRWSTKQLKNHQTVELLKNWWKRVNFRNFN